jgi:hypothetical protein
MGDSPITAAQEIGMLCRQRDVYKRLFERMVLLGALGKHDILTVNENNQNYAQPVIKDCVLLSVGIDDWQKFCKEAAECD